MSQESSWIQFEPFIEALFQSKSDAWLDKKIDDLFKSKMEKSYPKKYYYFFNIEFSSISINRPSSFFE